MIKRNGILICVLFIGFMACNGQQKQKEYGDAPLFILYNTDSMQISLQDYRGKALLVHFWADWCPHCREEFPKLQRAYEQLDREKFEILAVNSGQSRDHVVEIKETYGLTFPLLLDEQAMLAEKYQVAGLPSNYFVDQQGTIRQVIVSWMQEDQILQELNKLN